MTENLHNVFVLLLVNTTLSNNKQIIM